MTLTEFLLLLLVVAVIGFMVYYMLKGSKGHLDFRRPIESRVDEYLDRRFEDLINEWSLVTHPKVQAFREQTDQRLTAEEARVSTLAAFEKKISADLDSMEARLDALEKEGSPKAARGE